MESDYNVILFSMQDLLNTAEPLFSDLLYAMFYTVFTTFKDELGRVDKAILEETYNRWNSTITLEESSSNSSEFSADAGIDIKLGMLFSKILGCFKMNTEQKTVIRKTISADAL